ncbi:MAG: DHHA1 domain-containing protein [Promethearchaeota archaeon]
MTHTDLDGICCAALFLRKYDFKVDIIYATVKEAGELSRTGFYTDYTCDLPKIGFSVNIDHHQSNYEKLKESNRLSQEDIVDPTAASATDLVFEFLQQSGDSIAEEIKEIGHLADIALLPSIYEPLQIVLSMNSDNLDILRQISELLARKGNRILSSKWLEEKFDKISSIYVETKKTIKDFLAMITSFPRILIIDSRQAIHSKLAKEVFQPLFEQNVAVIALIYSKSSEEPLRVSFRVTKSEQLLYDVSIVARAFGGGGHRMAAACSPKSEEIPEILIQELEKIALQGDDIKYINLRNNES